MKVIFVASGNKVVGTVSPFVRSQYDSLVEECIDMILFPIVGKGWKSYCKSIFSLHRLVKETKADIVHAHYSTCGLVAWVAALGTRSKVVVSILGSFPKKNFKLHWVRFFAKHLWNATLTKSRRTANQIGLDLPVIPNGVNLDKFKIIDKEKARNICGFAPNKRYVIWCSNPSRPEKRFELAQQSVIMLNDESVILFPVYDRPHDEVINYMCAADVLLLTSAREGSPNVIKEAMACNCPIVSTDVGDVRDNLLGLDGTYVSVFDSTVDISNCLGKALEFADRTHGRKRIEELGLATNEVAKKILALYYSVI